MVLNLISRTQTQFAVGMVWYVSQSDFGALVWKPISVWINNGKSALTGSGSKTSFVKFQFVLIL